MSLDQFASWATIFSGFGLPLMAVVAWWLRKTIRDEVGSTKATIRKDVVPKLSNDDTSVARYAHDARDLAGKALELATTTDARITRVEAKLDAVILRNGQP